MSLGWIFITVNLSVRSYGVGHTFQLSTESGFNCIGFEART